MRIVVFILFTLPSIFYAQNIGINNTGNTPDNSAMLDVASTDKGVLIPRINIADLSTAAPITSPATSLLVYNTNTTTGVGYYYWDATKWVKLLDANANSDEDWHKATTTTAPTNINDDIFTRGKVGIGVNAPVQALDIENGNINLDTEYGIGQNFGSTSSEWRIIPRRNGIQTLTQMGSVYPYTDGMSLESDGGIAFVETDDDALVGYMNLNTDEFIWDGKIGIGTESPGAQLTIKGDARIRLDNAVVTQWDINIHNTNGNFAIQQRTNLISQGNRLVIDTTGLVGIGINTPVYQLDVQQDTAKFGIRIFNTKDAAGNGLLIESNGGSDDDTLILVRGDLNGTPADKFILIGDGRVGINHSTPNAITKLDVNGYMIAKNFLFSAHSDNEITNFSNGIVSFNQVIDTYGNSYTGNNTYTAPVDGYYFFSTDITFDGGDGLDDSMILQFLKNGVSTNPITIDPRFSSRDGNEINISNTAIIQLNAGETVSVSITGVDTGIVDYGKRNFMGYLVGKL